MTSELHGGPRWNEASFIWACPGCGCEQTEVITVHGPVMSLRCADCEREFDMARLPETVSKAWRTAIDRVIPKDESD